MTDIDHIVRTPISKTGNMIVKGSTIHWYGYWHHNNESLYNFQELSVKVIDICINLGIGRIGIFLDYKNGLEDMTIAIEFENELDKNLFQIATGSQSVKGTFCLRVK